MEPDQMKSEYEALKILNTIAVELNATVELDQALQATLQHTIDLMQMRAGWIWLLYPDANAVFLAASYQLPPAFTNHPERLSGWCYCIDKYLANHLDSAANISEISCSRLKDVQEEADGLRYHATVPLFDGEQKIGLLNIVSPASVKLDAAQLQLLHTIGELLSSAVVRARAFEQSKTLGAREAQQRLAQSFKQHLLQPLALLQQRLGPASAAPAQRELRELAERLHAFTQQTIEALQRPSTRGVQDTPFRYPASLLTPRELEVLELLKQGKTNKAIAGELFISERTVKFHVSTILDKLGAGNRTEAVQVAMKRGIITL